MFDGGNAHQTPRQIADQIKRPARLRAAEGRLADLKRRRAEIAAEIQRLNGLPPGPMGETIGADELRRLDAEQRSLAEQTGAARQELVAMRAVHGEVVRQALLPTLTAAAERGHDAIRELRAALDAIEEVNHELLCASAPEYFLLAPDLQHLAGRLARLAGRG